MRQRALIWVWVGLLGCPAVDTTDADGDGFAVAEDCDDADPTVYPEALERCDGVDNDCDGEVDAGLNSDAMVWYSDVDGDGFGNPLTRAQRCVPPDGGVLNGDDCDDADPLAYPGQSACPELEVRSCGELLAAHPDVPPARFESGVYELGAAGQGTQQVFCDMDPSDPGWTLLLKTDGVANDVLGYDDPLWVNEELLEPASLDRTPANAKFAPFVQLPITELRGCFEDLEEGCFTKSWSTSLTAVARFQGDPDIEEGHPGLPAGVSIQDRCPTFGLNTPYSWQRVRFGYTANNENNCDSNDSSVGFGTGELNKSYGADSITWGAGENCTASRCSHGHVRAGHPGTLWGR